MCRPACNGLVLQSEVDKSIITYLANSTQINGNRTHTYGQGDQYRRAWYGEGWGHRKKGTLAKLNKSVLVESD